MFQFPCRTRNKLDIRASFLRQLYTMILLLDDLQLARCSGVDFLLGNIVFVLVQHGTPIARAIYVSFRVCESRACTITTDPISKESCHHCQNTT